MSTKIVLSLTIVFVLIVGLIAYIGLSGFGGNSQEEPFYVGVTYCGNSTQDAKTLIDKVADYTNLFVLQSGTLMKDIAAVTEIGDYAINAGLDMMVFFGSDSQYYMELWLEGYDGHWGNHLAGIYYSDEPGGKMLDDEMALSQDGKWSFRKMANREITSVYFDENTTLRYYPDGKIDAQVTNSTPTEPGPEQTNGEINVILPENSTNYFDTDMFTVTYYPNGTIITTYSGFPPVSKKGSDLPYTYEQLWNARPLQTYDVTAETFTNQMTRTIDRAKDRSSQFEFNNLLTADYGLYWWDYKGGYDTVLAELGWNNSVAQEIGLVRGAANLQDKSWGTILTWKNTHAPYLADGEEIFSQMKTSYQAGAEYVLIFNYAEDMSGPYGTLQEEHFIALEQFWNEVVQNPDVKHGSIRAEAALVLPENYGWGMRRPDDVIWGLWDADESSAQIWTQLQNKLDQYGLKLDIVYDDSAYPVAGRYNNIFYWNQTT